MNRYQTAFRFKKRPFFIVNTLSVRLKFESLYDKCKNGLMLKMLLSLNPSFSLIQASQPLSKILGNLSLWIYLDNRQSLPFYWVH